MGGGAAIDPQLRHTIMARLQRLERKQKAGDKGLDDLRNSADMGPLQAKLKGLEMSLAQLQ